MFKAGVAISKLIIISLYASRFHAWDFEVGLCDSKANAFAALRASEVQDRWFIWPLDFFLCNYVWVS